MNTQLDHQAVLKIKLAKLREDHGNLDVAIAALHDAINADMLTLQRLKRQKLKLKDEIQRLEDALTPDIIA